MTSARQGEGPDRCEEPDQWLRDLDQQISVEDAEDRRLRVLGKQSSAREIKVFEGFAEIGVTPRS